MKKRNSRNLSDHRGQNGDMIVENGTHASETDHDYEEHMPDSLEIEKRFDMLVDNIDLPPERAAELKNKSLSLKWKMLQGQLIGGRQPV
eukprot:gene9244-10219_t